MKSWLLTVHMSIHKINCSSKWMISMISQSLMFFLGGKFSDILLVSWLNLPKHDVSSYHMSCSHLTKCPMSPGNQSFSTVAMMKNAYHCWFMLIKKWIGNVDCPLILIILILMNLHIKNFCINWITDIAVNIIGRSLAKRKDGWWNLSSEWTCKQVLESIWVRYFSLLRLFLLKKTLYYSLNF